MNVPLIKEFKYEAPIEKVWKALSDKGVMKKWYFPQLHKFEPVVGFKFQFDNSGAQYQKEWIVTTASVASHTLLDKVYNQLKKLLDYEKLSKSGLPTVATFADKLNVSPHYLSAALRTITGKNDQFDFYSAEA